jgi:hypothetical protein
VISASSAIAETGNRCDECSRRIFSAASEGLRVKGAAPSDQPIHADAKGAFNALIVKAEQHHAAAGR